MIRVFNSIEEIIKRVHDRDAPPLVIKFHATWCKPCKESAPWFESLVKQFPETEFTSVDVDDVEEALEVYSVKTIPAIHIWYRGGRAGIFANRDEFAKVEPLLVHLRDHNPAKPYANQCSLEVAHAGSSDPENTMVRNILSHLIVDSPKSATLSADNDPINFGFDNREHVPKLELAPRPKSEKRRRE